VSAGRGVFVTGTDTGVGKTVVACALLRGLRARGLDVGAMKPVETGVGAPGPLDAMALRDAAGGKDDLSLICPQRFALPAAPSVAAAHEGRRVEVEPLEAAFRALAARHRLLVVEGAGGLLVPLTDQLDMAGLAGRFGLPVLLVCRGALGTINHTRLSLEALAARRLPLAGVVISHASGVLAAAEKHNLDALRRELGARLLGEIPPLAASALPPPDALDLDALLRAVDS
jgi:dethiobiotin synthetase